MSVSIDRRIVDDAATTHDVTTWWRLRALGISEGAIRRRQGSLLQRAARGVYIVGRPHRRAHLYAALVAVEGSAAAGTTAAALRKMPLGRDDQIVVVAPNGRRLAGPVVVRQTRHLPSADVGGVAGFACTTVPRTICDLAADRDEATIGRLIEWAIIERRMTARELQACVAAFRRRGRPGSAALRRLDNDLLGTDAVPDSELERLAIGMFEAHGVDGGAWHFVPPWSDGTSGVVDVAWPDRRVIVELDGRRWHAASERMAADRRRDRQAVAHGWVVLRFGWQEIVERPAVTASEIRGLLDARAAA